MRCRIFRRPAAIEHGTHLGQIGLGRQHRPAMPDGFWLRLTVAQGVIRVQYSTDGQRWPLLRLAPFPTASRYLVGPMCCTPERGGLEVVFSQFSMAPAQQKDLHDLS